MDNQNQQGTFATDGELLDQNISTANAETDPVNVAKKEADKQALVVQSEKDLKIKEAAEDVFMIVTMIMPLAKRVLPRVCAVLDPELMGGWSHSLAAVGVKRGWFDGSMKARFGEELALLAATGTIAMMVSDPFKEDLAVLRARPVQAEPAVDPAAAPAPAEKPESKTHGRNKQAAN